MDKKDLDVVGLELQNQALVKKLTEIEKEKEKLLQIIKDNDLEDQLDFTVTLSDEEHICVTEIKRYKDVVDLRPLADEEVKNLDTLFKILRTIRTGKDPSPKKQKKINVADLLKVVVNG